MKAGAKKGVPFTNEHKNNIRKALTGSKLSEERKRKIGLANTGKRRTPEQLEKIRGKNHHCWKGGISCDNHRLRATFKYQQWRLKVYIRDNFTCQSCGKVGGYLNAHHIKSFAKYPKSRFDINNGVTLCKECHKLTDNFAGKNNFYV